MSSIFFFYKGLDNILHFTDCPVIFTTAQLAAAFLVSSLSEWVWPCSVSNLDVLGVAF